MGAALYFVNSRKLLPLWIPLLMFAVSFSLARWESVNVPSFVIGVSFALLINSAVGNSRRLPWRRLSRKAADFSYSAYLCHFPFLVFVLSAIYQVSGRGVRGPLTAWALMPFFLVLTLAYVWCYGVSLVTERQTPRIREWLYRFSLGRDVSREQNVAGQKTHGMAVATEVEEI